MSSQIYRAASRATRSLLSASKQSSHVFAEGRAAAAAAAISLRALASYGRANSGSASAGWIYGALALPAVAYMLQVQEMHAVEAEMERTFIAIKPNEQRAMFAEIMSRFERKGFKLVAIKGLPRFMIFFQRRYHHDLKERPFCDLLRDFLSASRVLVMVWEGEGVIRYGRKLIGATDPQKSEPGTIRGDLAVVFGRNFIHTSDGPGTAKDEIKLWFKPEELANYTSDMLLRHMAVILGMAIISSF